MGSRAVGWWEGPGAGVPRPRWVGSCTPGCAGAARWQGQEEGEEGEEAEEDGEGRFVCRGRSCSCCRGRPSCCWPPACGAAPRLVAGWSRTWEEGAGGEGGGGGGGRGGRGA